MAHLPASSDSRMKGYGSFENPRGYPPPPLTESSASQPVKGYPTDFITESFLNKLDLDDSETIRSRNDAVDDYVGVRVNQVRNAVFASADVDDNRLQRMENVPNDGLVNETDALLAKELNQLSMKEREEVYHDIHGVAEIIEETPEFVEIKLKELELELAKIPIKKAYNQAKEKSPEFVTSIRNCLMFLRADRFDATEAAARMVRYYEEKLHLFGPERLARDLRMKDLKEEERSSLESGYVQLLPGRDRAGRAIIFGLIKVRTEAFVGCAAILFWYLTMAALEDEETQKRGFVIIPYIVGTTHAFNRRNSYKIARLSWILPMRAAGLHGCTDDPRQRTLMNFAVMIIGTNMRVRTRIHFGSDLECQYQLMTFGISANLLPVDSDGVVSLLNHKEWIRSRIQQEESSMETMPRIHVPGPNDVLLGRGKLIQEHTGNLRFRHIVENQREIYEHAMKLEKTLLAREIVEHLQKTGGRFLKRDRAGWAEVDDETARYKVSHSFRNKRLAENQKKGKEVSNIETKAANAVRRKEDLDIDSKRARMTTSL